MWGVGEGGGDMLPDFFFCSLFPVQRTTSGIVHRVKSFFRVGNLYAECEKQQQQQQQDSAQKLFLPECACVHLPTMTRVKPPHTLVSVFLWSWYCGVTALPALANLTPFIL